MKNKIHNQIIHVSDTHVIIRLHTNETLNVPINELTFHPKVNDIVEVYQNHVVVCPLPQNNNLWILITSITFLILTIIGATFLFFRQSDRNIEAVDSQSSQQSSSTTSSFSASSSTSWVKANNAPITGVQVQIKKSMIKGWQEGATVTFTIKIMEDSEKFQFWVATDATLITTPTEEKHTENVI